MREQAILVEARRRGEGPSYEGLRSALPLGLALVAAPLAGGWFWRIAEQTLASIVREPQTALPRALTLAAAGALALVAPLGLTALALTRLRSHPKRHRRRSRGPARLSSVTRAAVDGALSVALLLTVLGTIAGNARRLLAFLDPTLSVSSPSMTSLAASMLSQWALPAAFVVLAAGAVAASLEHRAFVHQTLERARRHPEQYRPQGPSADLRRALDAARISQDDPQRARQAEAEA